MTEKKKYHLLIGIIVSVFISMLASVPRILKGDDPDYQSVLINMLYVFSLAVFCWVLHHFALYTRIPWSRLNVPWAKAVWSVILGIVISLVYHKLITVFIDASPILLDNVNSNRKLVTLIFRGLLISGFLFFVVYYLILSDFTQKSKLENERLKKENLQARLESLKQQVSPHFLFNSLNTLSTLTREPKVKEYIIEISNVYRYLLQYKENDMVTVEDELKFVASYLYILQERFESGLQVTITISEAVRKTLMPPLALQTLVENAVKHNIVSTTRPLLLDISSKDDFIIVRNNLQVKQSLGYDSSRSGLNNINERYRLLVNREIVIEKTENEFVVKLPVLV